MNVFDAAGSGDLQRVRALVEQDARCVRARDNNGWTPLTRAVLGGHVDVSRYLVDHGAAVEHRDHARYTALHWACISGHSGVTSFLLRRGADVTAAGAHGTTPLIAAASHGRDTIVRLLLEHGGSDVDATEYDECTACHHACRLGHAGVLRKLLEAGAESTLLDMNGRTAMDTANLNGHPDCIAILQEWERAYALVRARCVRNATSSTAPAASPGF